MLVKGNKERTKMLTFAQRRTDAFIRQFIAEHEYSPTIAEIAKGVGIKSRGAVYRSIKALVAAGRITLTPKRHRNINIVSSELAASSEETSLPLVGIIAAGSPIEAIERQDVLDVANVFIGSNRYALRVRGDSMKDEGIFDGDVIICEQCDWAENGKIVVALVDREAATLKRFYYNSDGTITLQPANSALQPILYFADRITVQGVYIGLLRFT